MLRLQSAVALLAFLALASCDDTGGPPSPREGTTRVLLTDAPFPYDQVARADIHVLNVAASAMGSDTWQSIVSPNRTFDLVALNNGRTVDLGEGVLTPGTYDRVVLEIDPGRSSITLTTGAVLTGSSTPGIRWTSSVGADQAAFAVFVDAPIQVSQAGALIVVALDLARSFRPNNPARLAAGVQFIPFARAVDGTATGSIAGTVVGAGGGPLADATASLYAVIPSASPGSPTPTVALWETARTDATGRFVLPYLAPGRTYSLTVDAALESSYGSATRSVSVTTGTETSVGTVTIPAFDATNVTGTYVLRRVGPPESSRELPATMWPGPTQIWLVADTLVLDATGSGSEVRVERTVPPGQPPVTRTTKSMLTYNRRGRVVSITYQCPGGNCGAPIDGVLEGTLLTLYLPHSPSAFPPWPRAFEWVGK
jgi:hypothetical protein